MQEGEGAARPGTPRCLRRRGLRESRFVLVCLAAAAWSAVGSGAAAAPARRSEASDPLVVVGPAPRPPVGAAYLGRALGSRQMALDVVLRPRDPAALAAFAGQVSDPDSALFRHYIGPGSFAARFGPAPGTLRAVTAGLARLGLRLRSVSEDHLLLRVSAPTAVLERALHVSIDRYRLASGARVFTNASPPLLPVSLASQVTGVVGLDDLPLLHPFFVRPSAPAVSGRSARSVPAGLDVPGGPASCPAATKGTGLSGPYTADELAYSYGFSQLYEAGDLGAGQTVAVFELESFSEPNVRTYDECYFGATLGAAMARAPHLNVMTVDPSEIVPSVGDDVEATLDVEEMSGFVPQATVDVYEGPNSSTGPLDVWEAIVSQDKAKVITTSWGTCEAEAGGAATLAAEANLFEEAAAQGQSIIAASGDEGSSDCTDAAGTPLSPPAVDDPGSQPYVTGVGGTRLSSLGSPVNSAMVAVAPDQRVWNSDGGASGGGISSSWTMPAYQLYAPKALKVVKSYSSPKPCGAPAGFCRQVPDVSADADPATGLMIYWTGWGGWSYVGGTSIAAPLWGALAALANAWPSCDGQAVGFLNPTLYWVAGLSAKSYAETFDEVTVGDNHLSQFPNWWQYPATDGYNLATGLGTPVAADPTGGGLVAQLCSLPGSGGQLYASPTRSSVTAVLGRAKAEAGAFSWVKVRLRTAAGLPIGHKRVILVGTVTTPTGFTWYLKPTPVISTNAKGLAVFQVSDTTIQKVTYNATDLTDGVVLQSTATVRFVAP